MKETVGYVMLRMYISTQTRCKMSALMLVDTDDLITTWSVFFSFSCVKNREPLREE